MVPGSISSTRERDLPGGPALARGEARSAGQADAVGDGDHAGQQPAARASARRHVGGHRRRASRRAPAGRARRTLRPGHRTHCGLAPPRARGAGDAADARERFRTGRFSLEEEQDSGVTYRVTVEIGPSEFVVDLRDNPDQDAGPANVSARRSDDRRPDGADEPHRCGARPRTPATSGRSGC